MTGLKYDSSDSLSIEAYAKLLIGKTFLDIINDADLNNDVRVSIIDSYGNPKRKGGLGNLLEEIYFGYKANNDQEPDFKEAGVELKVSPYEKLNNGKYRAGERLIITMIGYAVPIELDFKSSHVWNKIRLILLIYYLRNREIDNLLYPIDYAKLFSPPEEDLAIIKNDYEKIVSKIQKGLAHQLSESDTMYLGACTKGATAEKGIVPQYYNPYVPAMTRAFCFKVSYMNYVFNHYVLADVDTYKPPKTDDFEPIIKSPEFLEETSFESYIENKIKSYSGKTDEKLCELFGRAYNNNKAQWIDLAYRMLGIRSNRAEEFEKANIIVKSIRIESDGKMVESMSLPPFRFKDLANEEWEDSELFTYFDEKRFLFVVYEHSGDNYILKGGQIWNMPADDLNEIAYHGWKNIQNKIKSGVSLKKIETKNGYEIKNDLPKKKDNKIIHIRPHTAKRAYILSSGEIIGNAKKHANELPDGQWMTTQSFWINNDYILSQIKL